MRLPIILTLACATLFGARLSGADWPAPRFVPVLPSNTDPTGPAIPNTPAREARHPAPIALWENGAPGSEARRNEPEQISYRQEADIVFPIVFNIHNPSITPFLPSRGRATGAAVIIAPGGGNMFHTIDREGYDFARWLADNGVAAFVLKYRLGRDAANMASGAPQPYTSTEHAAADGLRAIRLVRARAAEWNIRPDRIGLLGFSAGGYVAQAVATRYDAGNPNATDPIERVSSRPDFFAPVYAGGSQRIADQISKEKTPPAFLLVAQDDRVAEDMANFFVMLKKAGVEAELHIYGSGGHGFGVRADRGYSVEKWPTVFLGWLGDRGFLKK